MNFFNKLHNFSTYTHELTLKIIKLSYHLNSYFKIQTSNITFLPGLHLIIGENGSGKSSLLKILGGIWNNFQTKNTNILKLKIYKIHNKQQIFINNTILTKQKAQNIYPCLFSYTPQFMPNYLDLNVFEFLISSLYCKKQQIFSIENIDKTNNILEQYNLSKFKNKYIYQLSGGEFQKIFILRAIIPDTPFLLFDEPISFLDIKGRKFFINVLKKLITQGKTILVITHDLDFFQKHIQNFSVWEMQKGTLNKYQY